MDDGIYGRALHNGAAKYTDSKARQDGKVICRRVGSLRIWNHDGEHVFLTTGSAKELLSFLRTIEELKAW